MKFSIFPNFGALNSKPVFEAFKQGAKTLGHDVVEHDLTADVFVIWSVLWHGRMMQNKIVWNQAKKLGKQIIILEVGCLCRGITWKLGVNHVNNKAFFGSKFNLMPNRAKKLGLHLHPWTMAGENILICGQHTKSEQWSNMPDPISWLKSTVDSVKSYSSKPIIFRPHPRDYSYIENVKSKDFTIKIPKKIENTYDDFDFDNDLKNAWAVINPSSNTGILSVLNGVPAFVSADSLAASVGNLDYSCLNNPLRPSREEWLEWLSHTEWTIEEIASGFPIRRIFY